MDPKIEIKEATADDALLIAKIHAQSWSRSYGNVLTPHYLGHVVPSEREKIWKDRFSAPKPDQYVLTAKIDGQIVGFACAYLDGIKGQGAYLDNLHVSLPYQRTGIGQALLRAIALKCFETYPRGNMSLTVNQDNLSAQAFYLRLGAHNAGEDIWNAPDGSVVPTYWFTWDNVEDLAHD